MSKANSKAAMDDHIIRMINLNKWYGNFHVLKDINLDERCELVDLMMQVSSDKNPKMFTSMVNCIRIGTDMTDEQINDFTNEEIIELFKVIGDALNKKK